MYLLQIKNMKNFNRKQPAFFLIKKILKNFFNRFIVKRELSKT